MIKIIRGVYGVNRLTSQSAPFALSEKEEARLVALGVAEYVDAPEAPDAPETDAAEIKAEKQTKGKGKKAAKK